MTKRVQRQRLLIGQAPPPLSAFQTEEQREETERGREWANEQAHRRALEAERARWSADLGLQLDTLAWFIEDEEWALAADTSGLVLGHLAHIPGGDMPPCMRGLARLVRALEGFATHLERDDDEPEGVEVEDDEGEVEDDEGVEVEGERFGFVDDDQDQLALFDTTPPAQRQQRLRWMGR